MGCAAVLRVGALCSFVKSSANNSATPCLKALISCVRRQGSIAPAPDTDGTSLNPHSEPAAAFKEGPDVELNQLEVPDVEPTQMPEIRVEHWPDEVGEAPSGSISSTSRPPVPVPLLISRETFPSKVSGFEGGSAPGESSEPPLPASATVEPPDMYDKIANLKKHPDGTDAEFVPEHSLRQLFKKPDGELEKHLIHHLKEKKKFDANAI